jgi:hypothetical protein
MFGGVIKVEQFAGSLPAVLRHVPNPRGTVTHHQFVPGPAQPVTQSLPMAAAKLHRIALPAKDDLAFDDPMSTRRVGGLFVRN